VKEKLRGNEWFLYYLLESELGRKPPIGLLGRFVLDKSDEHRGELSLKQAGSVFIVDCLRMFMLEKGFEATTTIERLAELVKLGVFKQEAAQHIKDALEAFIFLRLRNEIALIDEGREPSHFLDPYTLTAAEQDLLKEALRVVGKLQDSARRHFGQGVL
jgi:CBS domain-containing protein